MPERFVNAVVSARIPLDVSPDATKEEKLLAAVAKVDELNLFVEDGFEVTFEDVVDGEPAK